MTATLSLTGYLYGAAQMYMIPAMTGIAFQTASVVTRSSATIWLAMA